jgi:GNAT superfamily N-acetyltransferase
VTKRANSALPPADARRQEAGLAAAIDFYRRRQLPVTVQLPNGPEYSRLDVALAERGFRVVDPTLILERRIHAASVERPAHRDPDPAPDPAPGSARRSAHGVSVTIVDAPEPDWFRLWWSVDGRGGVASAHAAQHILTATPSRYLALRAMAEGGVDHDGTRTGTGSTTEMSAVTGTAILGVARLSATARFVALSCVAVAAGQRKRGYGRLLLDAATAETARLGLGVLQLQVTSANPAVDWYERAGFRRVSGYHYRVEAARA